MKGPCPECGQFAGGHFAGCPEDTDRIYIPGHILALKDGKRWLRQDGSVTDVFAERGVWPTEDDASAALDSFFNIQEEGEE